MVTMCLPRAELTKERRAPYTIVDEQSADGTTAA